MMLSALLAQTRVSNLGEFRGFGTLGLKEGVFSAAPSIFNQVLSAIIGIMTVSAGIYFIFLFITGGIQYLTSGGDKAATEAARGRITMAVTGLVIVVAAVFIIDVIGTILGFDILNPGEFVLNLRFKK